MGDRGAIPFGDVLAYLDELGDCVDHEEREDMIWLLDHMDRETLAFFAEKQKREADAKKHKGGAS